MAAYGMEEKGRAVSDRFVRTRGGLENGRPWVLSAGDSGRGASMRCCDGGAAAAAAAATATEGGGLCLVPCIAWELKKPASTRLL